ncbi:ABC-type transport system involved in cytochrome bd biosynthesis fused ATPase/permease subunit [Mycobacterium sp. OAS707]|uniref:DUF3040 domain-containing protein n=1 Tax=Mycobacterium sp. OAS707 TaxID=2663822 RepID=UPI00178A39D1|nr:DUF3040 domain-containing protein [Mycobacterium sp. OAS707]MBE1552181.1 ABC-type transport system involved in cytochrome bd biosynthesis fused ATPase/permease subunit [Mycobacterium sp. OAS707]
MPLSDREQRVLDALEHDLADVAPRWNKQLHRRTRARVVYLNIVAALLFSVGFAVMVAAVDFGAQRLGVMLIVCILAYLSMFAALLILLRGHGGRRRRSSR